MTEFSLVYVSVGSPDNICSCEYLFFNRHIHCFRQFPGLWRDTVCKKTVRHCTVCDIRESSRVFTLRGLCADSQFDRGYFLTNGLDKEIATKHPIYEGTFSQIHSTVGEKSRQDAESGQLAEKAPHLGTWMISSRIRSSPSSYWAVTNATSQLGYPLGRHLWLVTDPKCDLFQPTWTNLTLSRCLETEFTCNDGTCIPVEQRCDLLRNCQDFSDELGCDTVRGNTFIVPQQTLTALQ